MMRCLGPHEQMRCLTRYYAHMVAACGVAGYPPTLHIKHHIIRINKLFAYKALVDYYIIRNLCKVSLLFSGQDVTLYM